MQARSHNISGRDVTFERAKLRKWFELEEIKNQVAEAADKGETLTASEMICSYLSAASDLDIDFFSAAPWYEVAVAYGDVAEMNTPHIKFPIFDTVSSDERDNPWDYVGRSWILWVHTVAREYGWKVEYIESLEIETGVGLIEEIMVDSQLRREWEWQLSEIAYPYNPSSKKSEFKPLRRPSWMATKPSTVKKTKLRKSMLPVGVIVNKSGMSLHGIDEETES